jgi:hypothetical protein
MLVSGLKTVQWCRQQLWQPWLWTTVLAGSTTMALAVELMIKGMHKGG